jgi:hypothetical protein
MTKRVIDALPFGGAKGSDKIFRMEHQCNQKRLLEIERFTEEDKAAELARLRISRPELMRKEIKKLWTLGRNLYHCGKDVICLDYLLQFYLSLQTGLFMAPRSHQG